jgi:hypothetical protein
MNEFQKQYQQAESKPLGKTLSIYSILGVPPSLYFKGGVDIENNCSTYFILIKKKLISSPSAST